MDAKINEILNFIYGLSPAEITILVAITAILIVFIVYRWFGIIVVCVVLLIYMLIYVLYTADILNFYEKHNQEESQHMKVIEKELKK